MIRVGLLVLELLLAGCGGPPGPTASLQMVAPVECIGIPAGTCQQIVTDARRNAEPGTFPVRIRAACTRAAGCTLQEGDVSVEVDYSNGRQDAYGMGWAGPGGGDPAPPVVVLPVAPTCEGVPARPCEERAREAVGAVVEVAAIRSIVVRCVPDASTPTCTDANGVGTTVVTFADGTTQSADWGYASGG